MARWRGQNDQPAPPPHVRSPCWGRCPRSPPLLSFFWSTVRLRGLARLSHRLSSGPQWGLSEDLEGQVALSRGCLSTFLAQHSGLLHSRGHTAPAHCPHCRALRLGSSSSNSVARAAEVGELSPALEALSSGGGVGRRGGPGHVAPNPKSLAFLRILELPKVL